MTTSTRSPFENIPYDKQLAVLMIVCREMEWFGCNDWAGRKGVYWRKYRTIFNCAFGVRGFANKKRGYRAWANGKSDWDCWSKTSCTLRVGLTKFQLFNRAGGFYDDNDWFHYPLFAKSWAANLVATKIEKGVCIVFILRYLLFNFLVYFAR